ncbi:MULTISPECIES: hypothetical protein [unclassified Aureimonas]|uniref:hypothetical protein n=1 Tax=unclassified Aureimonas TaxID=2615206 RepID=UPI000781489C|nr:MULTISPECIES: hypothetical protein [unclassified Aureimonas]
MTKVHLIDENAVWIETRNVDLDLGRPVNSVLVEPPQFDPQKQFAVWSGDTWLLRPLSELPATPIAADPVPSEVTPAQAKIALYDAGLYGRVKAIIDGSDAYEPMRIWWESALVWRLDNPNIHALAAVLKLTDDQVDDLFRAAAKVAQ